MAWAISSNSARDTGRYSPLSRAASIAHAGAGGLFRGAPEHVDAGHVDDGLEGELPGGGQDGGAEGDGAHAAQLEEGLIAGAFLDGAGDALGEEEPPGDDVPVPGVDDAVHLLAQEISFYDFDRGAQSFGHRLRAQEGIEAFQNLLDHVHGESACESGVAGAPIQAFDLV